MARYFTLAQKRADPNKRRTLPTSMLTPAQQHERARLAAIAKQDANPLYDPSAPLAGHSLAAAVKQIVDSIYGPQESAIDRQTADTQAQDAAVAQRAAGYASSADAMAAQAQAREQALTERLNASLAQVGQATQSQLAQAGTDARARFDQDAALRGGGLGGGGDQAVAGELAAARARAAGDSQAFGSTGALQGANYEGLLGATRAAQQLRGTETQGQLATREANDLAELRAKRADLESTRGGEYAKELLALRQSEFTNQATREGLGLKSAALSQDAKQKAADRSLRMQITQLNNAERERLAALSHGDRAAALAWQKRRDALQRKLGVGPYRPATPKTPKTPNPATGPGSRSPEAEQRTVSKVLSVQRILDSGVYTPPGKDAKPVKGLVAIKGALAAQNVDPRIIAVAESLHRNRGKLGPYGARMAHRLGLHVHGNFSTVG